MKIIWRSLVVAAFILTLVLVSAGQTKNSRMQDEILKLESEFARAVIKNDVAAVEKIVADDWIIIDADGHVIDRSRFLEVMRSGVLTHEEMKSSEERVRILRRYGRVHGLGFDQGKIRRNGVQLEGARDRCFHRAEGKMAMRIDADHAC